MNATENVTLAASIVQCGAALNSLNAGLRTAGEFKTADKKLQSSWTELKRISINVYTRLIGKLDGPTGDYINTVSNQSEQVLRCLCHLPADQRRKLVAYAEDLARPFSEAEAKHESRAAPLG